MWGPSEFSADGNLLKVHIENIDRITCPTLVIYGSEDEIAANQPNIYKSLTGVKKKELFVVQGGKHMTWLDDPDRYFGESTTGDRADAQQGRSGASSSDMHRPLRQTPSDLQRRLINSSFPIPAQSQNTHYMWRNTHTPVSTQTGSPR